MAHEHVGKNCPCCGDKRTPNDDSFRVCKKCRPRVTIYTAEYKAKGITSGHFTKAEQRVAKENDFPYVIQKQSTKRRATKKKCRTRAVWHNLPLPMIGVYALYLDGVLQYIGKAEENAGGINSRVADHMRNKDISFDSAKYTELSVEETAKFEDLAIPLADPPCNKKGKRK